MQRHSKCAMSLARHGRAETAAQRNEKQIAKELQKKKEHEAKIRTERGNLKRWTQNLAHANAKLLKLGNEGQISTDAFLTDVIRAFGMKNPTKKTYRELSRQLDLIQYQVKKWRNIAFNDRKELQRLAQELYTSIEEIRTNLSVIDLATPPSDDLTLEESNLLVRWLEEYLLQVKQNAFVDKAFYEHPDLMEEISADDVNQFLGSI